MEIVSTANELKTCVKVRSSEESDVETAAISIFYIFPTVMPLILSDWISYIHRWAVRRQLSSDARQVTDPRQWLKKAG